MALPSTDGPVTAPGPRARNRIAREQAYLDAAMEIALRDGLEALTMTRLAESVDAAVGTVYTYFPSKGALVAEMQRVAIERLTASYHQTRDRSERELAGWDDPKAIAVARLDVFGRFWVASVETLPEESGLLHGLISQNRMVVPDEERHRVLPTALALLGEARDVVVGAAEVGAIAIDDPIGVVIRWAAALTGVLLTVNLKVGSPIDFNPIELAVRIQRDLLVGWGAPIDLVERAERHVAALESGGPLAPQVDPIS